jgi:2-oxoglutarate/2-oxoacid ferredoxin oxidoreductase subunit alpha
MSNAAHQAYSIAIVGSGGAGVMTLGAVLLEVAARTGYYGSFSRLLGLQVRGGEAAALLTVSTTSREVTPDEYDCLVAIDWGHVDRFATDIPLAGSNVIIADPKQGAVPVSMRTAGSRMIEVAFSDIARGIKGARPNMVALGVAGGLLGFQRDVLADEARRRFRDQDAPLLSGGLLALRAGYEFVPTFGVGPVLGLPAGKRDCWLVSGNEAVAIGALRGGVRFVAGYPITPATEVVEWIAPRIEQVGGQFVQAEDELAAISMALGASFGGVPSMSVTSGPGLSLMTESLGLATAAEIPVVVVDVMRTGPSTGIPTRTEQADLNLAVYGAHGSAPRVVVAPTSVADCVETTRWAVEIAESRQTPVIVLSDQLLGQTRVIIDPVAASADHAKRAISTGMDAAYRRYASNASGVSPTSIPGSPGLAWVAEGLIHDESGAPSATSFDHRHQLDKRRHKLEGFDYGPHWAEVSGDGDIAVVTWGSSCGAVQEAIDRLREDALNIRMVCLRLLAPLPVTLLARALSGVQAALVIELNHDAQLARILKGGLDLPLRWSSFARPGPHAFRPSEVEHAIIRWNHSL